MKDYADEFRKFYTSLPRRYRHATKRRFVKAWKEAKNAFDGNQTRPMSRFGRALYMSMLDKQDTYYGA